MADLSRFIEAQKREYANALREIQSGHKRTHWIWYIFPQIAGLGMSGTAQYYSIRDLDEARAYMENSYLKENLIEISNALLQIESSDPRFVMGFPDDLKLRSCMTLFREVSDDPVFDKVLEKFYGGEADERTLELI